MLKNISELKITGKMQSSFIFDFDKTLKLIDYKIESLGNINKTEIKIKKPIKYQFLKKNIDHISLNKTEFKINYEKEKKKLINISGSYKINNNSFQKYEVKHIYESKLQKLYIKGDFDNEINLPILNFNSKNKILSVNTELKIKPNFLLFKKFVLKEGKSKIDLNNLYIKDKKLVKLDNLSVKTFNEDKFNNDFNLSIDRAIKLKGSKYDASNLTQIFEKKSQSDFFSNINREILINVKEISTNLTDFISNFNLIGYIEKGKFNKIVSKGEFTDGKYLDISLKIDKSSKKKILGLFYLLTLIIIFFLTINYDIYNKLNYDSLFFYKEKIILFKESHLMLSILIFSVSSMIWVFLMGFIFPFIVISGLLFGQYYGTIICVISFTFGATANFVFAKYFFKKKVNEFFRNK